MIKVLLVFEDFNELTATETVLKKVGFDVVGINSEISMQEQLLAFYPDIVVAHGKSSRVSSLSVGQKMKENHRYPGKVVIVVPKDVRPSPQEMIKMKMDGILEAPLQAEKLIQLLSRLMEHDPQPFLEKLQKAKLSDPNAQKQTFKVSGPAASSDKILIQDPERAKKYATIVKGTQIDIKQSTHERNEIKQLQKELKKDWDFDQLDEQDKLKRQFAEALFKKK
jgi:DNA-binding NtrC family response regulator